MTITVHFDRDMYHLQGDMEIWCSKNIGKNPPYRNWVGSEPVEWEGLGNWCMSSIFGSTFFYFKEEKHANWFIMRWSNAQ